jgi:hypothetical protein
MLVVASRAMIVSGIFGITAATRSPGFTPKARSACAVEETRSYNSAKLSLRRTLFSPQNTSAVSWSRRRSRLAAKLRRASGNQRAPGILLPSIK